MRQRFVYLQYSKRYDAVFHVFTSSEGKTPPVESKNGKKMERGGGDAGGGPKHSMVTWFVVLSLLGVWSSLAVVYFEIVDYDSVIGERGVIKKLRKHGLSVQKEKQTQNLQHV